MNVFESIMTGLNETANYEKGEDSTKNSKTTKSSRLHIMHYL